MRATRTDGGVASALAVLSSVLGVSAVLTLPTDTELGQWEYAGCYTEVGRTINAHSTSSNTMTIQKCIDYCENYDMAYAGVEYASECYCGNKLATGAAKATSDSDCSMACSGNATEPCGGPNRLTMFYNQYNKGPQPNLGIKDWPFLGCYTEGTGGRSLTYGAGLDGSTMTGAKCAAACETAGFTLAGTEYGGECYCGNDIVNKGAPATDGCDMTCNGNSTLEVCGGSNRLNIYDYKGEYAASMASSSTTTATTTVTTAGSTTTSAVVTTSEEPAAPTTEPAAPTTTPTATPTTAATSTATTTSTKAAPTGPEQPDTIGNYNFVGCMTEAAAAGGARTLAGKTTASDTMTLETCATFCSAYTYFGIEYGRECYCGNSFTTGAVSAPESECSMVCPGDNFEYCGAGNRLSVYAVDGTAIPTTSSTTTAPTGGSTTTSTPAAVATGFPDGWSYQGCWQDGPNGRIMPTFQAPDNTALTRQSCAQLCSSKGYSISGTEYYSQCFCSNAIYNGGSDSGDETKCGTACSGDATQKCGGAGYLSIVSNGEPQVYQPPQVQTGGLNGTWTYQGCVQDNVNNKRTLPWALMFPNTNTAEVCLGRCAEFGYMAAGVEYGDECYCGDPLDFDLSGAAKVAESQCNVVCAGNASAYCGGGGTLNMYYWTGETPLYVFDYPTGNDAGTYSNLVGGVVTPLMTMQSITGKVTFLEKWGTGAANSTGAYELDLSVLNNFDAAWRTMHVKTDIFCSAGLILPDKGGRQLTVGGWSLDSTYGVRLYWPDGSDGVKGTRDWEEDVTTLKLKKGRWYPSAMTMTNGSILVIGGEIGSNDKPEPTLEILPDTGAPALYMDWLERTDPNNLYPFLCVLPSGGIFVQYWNEARILDEKTFATIKTLPNAPGGVADSMAGRTYPLEGAAVLLPQKAPYSDPLGILICGGATTGSLALDNCVTIYPDAAEPEWTLERMPSKRVMSCMAPLPDGTYMIVNGAKQGVAGFGLADNPNLNALLYDPEKPVGHRISVMANTTVARLYHSESITLLDGRVLVTGSDPQDGKHPEEIRVEVFTPPYLYSSKRRPSFTINDKDWGYGESITFTLAQAPIGAIKVSLLGAVSSTHGNSMGARTIFPAVSCSGTTCTVTTPPDVYTAPLGWYQMFVLEDGIPAVGTYVRIGGDPAGLGNWPQGAGWTRPGV